MRPVLQVLSQLVASVLAVLFMGLTPLVLFLFTTEWQLFQAPIYARALERLDLYERLPSLAAEQWIFSLARMPAGESSGDPESGDDEGELAELLRGLSPRDVEVIFGELMPASWLQAQAESILEQTFALLEPGEASPSVMISMVEVKARLLGEPGRDALDRLIHSWPPCTAEQLAEMANLAAGLAPNEGMGVVTCLPPEALVPTMLETMHARAGQMMAKVPDEFDLTQTFNDGEDGPGGAAPSGPDPRPALQRARLVMRLSPVLPVGLMLSITIFGVRSLKGGLRWWGIPLLNAGLISLGLAVGALPAFNSILRANAEGLPANLAPGVLQAALDVARFILRALVSWVAIGAAALGLLGFVLFGGSFLFGGRAKEPGSSAPAMPPPGP